jgi:hypothetical protein
MSVTATELSSSGQISADTNSGWKATRSFVVTSDVATDVPDSFTALNQTGIFLGQEHPIFHLITCKNVTAQRDEDNPCVWRVSAEYATDAPIDPVSGGGGVESGSDAPPGTQISFGQVWNMDVQATFVDQFRRAGDTTNGRSNLLNTIPETDSDIGGEPVDSGGDPQSVLVTRAKLNIDMTIQLSPSSVSSYFNKIMDLTGTRNSSSFLGAQQGQLLYTGANTRFLGNSGSGSAYQITHSMVFDEFRHKIQVADRDVDKQGQFVVRLGASTDSDGGEKYVNHAFKVRAVQPFPEERSFFQLGITI